MNAKFAVVRADTDVSLASESIHERARFRWVSDLKEAAADSDTPGADLSSAALTPYADCPGLVRSTHYASMVRRLAAWAETNLPQNVQIDFERSPFGGDAASDDVAVKVLDERGAVKSRHELHRYPLDGLLSLTWQAGSEALFFARVRLAAYFASLTGSPGKSTEQSSGAS